MPSSLALDAHEDSESRYRLLLLRSLHCWVADPAFSTAWLAILFCAVSAAGAAKRAGGLTEPVAQHVAQAVYLSAMLPAALATNRERKLARRAYLNGAHAPTRADVKRFAPVRDRLALFR